jgi:hypothetical protein
VSKRSNPSHTILDGERGQGGDTWVPFCLYRAIRWLVREGEIKFFIDGDGKLPTINGTGTEDYFGASYGFPETYTTAYAGNTLSHSGENGPPKWSLYRWHIMDPINFQKDLKVNIQTLGWWPNGKYQSLSDDVVRSLTGTKQNRTHSSEVSGALRTLAKVAGVFLARYAVSPGR